MRTTLEIDDDVMLAAKELARLRNQGIGRTISELARRGLVPETSPVDGWATSPHCENGFIRIVSHPSYPNVKPTPMMAAQSLARFKAGFRGVHRFWADEISLTDETFDSTIPWRAVRGAGAELVDRIAP